MSANSNDIEIRLKFLSERMDSIDTGVKKLEELKKQALTTGSILKTAFEVQGINEAMRLVGQGFAELKKTIDLGGELADLSARTGQTVSDLVVLRQAFENAGIGAGATGQLLNLLQKSLTGLNEQGEPTSKAFDRLGISLEALKGQTAVEQIATLSAAFEQIKDPADRTRTAMELFGRSGAQMLAVLSDPSAIGTAKDQVGSLGETMEKNAEAFDKLGDSWDAIGLRFVQLFAGIAEQVAPLLQHIADEANKLDLTEVGKEIGDLVLALTALLKIAAPVALVLGSQFVLEATLGKLGAFAAGVAASTKAIATESAALAANTAAQSANAAARGGNAAVGALKGAPAAGGILSMNPTQANIAGNAANEAARLSQAKSILDANAKLALLGKAAADSGGLLTKFGGVLSGIGKGAAANPASLILPAAIGYAIGDAIQEYGFNWATSLAAGGASTESDRKAAEERAGNDDLAKFMDQARGVSSDEDLSKLKAAAQARLDSARGERSGLWWNQTAQKDVLDGEISALERFAKSLEKIDPSEVRARAEAAAEDKKRAERDTAETEGKAKLSAARTEIENARRFDALPTNQKLDTVRANIAAQENTLGSDYTDAAQKTAAAEKLVELRKQEADLEKELADWQAGHDKDAKDKADAAAEETALLKAQVQIDEARAAGKEKVAARMELELEIQKELDDLRENGVTDEDLLSKHAEQKRQAFQKTYDLKGKEFDLDTRMAEAKARGDEAEVEKLEWLRVYNRLKAEGYREDQAQRAANAASGSEAPKSDTTKSDTTKPGELFKGTNRRRGIGTSDAFEENVPVGESLLDHYKKNQRRAVGAVNGRSILPDDPASSWRPPPGGEKPADAGKSPVADAGKEAAEGAKAAGQEAAGSMRELGSAIAAGFQGINKEIASVKAKVEALSKNI